MNHIFPKLHTNVRAISYHKVRNWYGNLVKPRQKKPPYNHVIQIGDPTLRAPAQFVPQEDIQTDQIQVVIKQMKQVFHKYDCLGMAAPQVGVALNIIIFAITKANLKYYTKEEQEVKEICLHPLTVVINPTVKITDYTKVIYPESCESIKGFWADVPRFRALELKGLNEDGESIAFPAKGWLARIIQHEMDHLSGKLYTDIMDRKSLTCGCWQVINERNGKVNLPYGPD